MNGIEQYLLQLNTAKQRWRRVAMVLTALSLIVAFVTIWNLRMTGVTIANDATCGKEEHQHSEACLNEGVAVCGFEEHVHAITCYSDPNADVETAADWEETIPSQLTSRWAEDLALIARSQIGNKESERNYVLGDDGQTKKGITRYGQWYGNPHGDWSAMFVSFCLNYANVPQSAIPQSSGVYSMMALFDEKQILSQPDAYIDSNGNILFVDTDNNGKADKMLIVTASDEAKENMILAVGGDWEDSVKEVSISKDDKRILAYVSTAAVREAYLNSLPLYSIDKNNNVYTVDVYAYPVDYNGKRITELEITSLGELRVNSTTKIKVSDELDSNLGVFHSAYFGSENSVEVDNVKEIWRYRQSSSNYYLAYSQTNGKQNQRWKNRADTSISLYLRYTPEFEITFKSEGFESLVEYVGYKGYLDTAEPAWSREGYVLVGWRASDNNTVYTFEEVLSRVVTKNVTYTAQWVINPEISFNLGSYADMIDPIEPIIVSYGGTVSSLPVPSWKNNSVSMAFDGWYLNSELTQPLQADHAFYEDSVLYAKWAPKEDGYYVYFMDFAREGQTPLVLKTYSVTEGKLMSSYTPGSAPDGTVWDGKWYLDSSCAKEFNFATPVSQMTDYLTGANNRDLYLYPGTQKTCRAIFVTYGTKIDPVNIVSGDKLDLSKYKPSREGYVFAGWALKDGTAVSGMYTLDETTTFYATWDAGYVSFEAILRIENSNDTGMTQADIIGTWYALSGSHIRVNSTYSGSGNNRTGTHNVVCVLNGKEYPVYSNADKTRQATLSDVYSTYFVYNNTGTKWTDEVNWDDVYSGGEIPYSTRPISSAGDTIINFDYMRVRNDIVFTIPNSYAYIDIYKLRQSGLITGSVSYVSTRPTTTGVNASATGVSGTNVSWSYTAASSNYGNNLYTLHNMKYGQRVYEVYPVGGSWLTTKSEDFHWYLTGGGQKFSSRREDLSADFFSGSGRKSSPYSLKAEFENQNHVALMYAIECLTGETADFTLNGVGYKVQTQLCEVVNHTGNFSIKSLLGCMDGVNPLGNKDTDYYSRLNSTTAVIGNTSVKTLFGTTYWKYYGSYVNSLSDIDRAYIFYYNRMYMNIQFNFAYDNDGNGSNDVVEYDNIAYGESIAQYQNGKEGYAKHQLLNRDGYEFAGWLDANGYVLEAEDWESMISTGDSENNTMIFIAKWEKISNNIVEYYEDRTANEPFESHYFDNGELMQFPTMTVYPEGWVWQEYGTGEYENFDWDVPMYGEYGVTETRMINGKETIVNVIRIYGTWDESHTKIIYDANAALGGVKGTEPVDGNEYTIWQSEVSLKNQGSMTNDDADMIFVGWLLDRNGIVYQPGEHVPVRWPRTMTFTAQWAKAEELVRLRYDANGGTPEIMYPDDLGFSYKKNATAAVWANTNESGETYFVRPGYNFIGWNTKADGSGTAYAVNSSIILTQPVTTLYAQWESRAYTVSLNKVDSESGEVLSNVEFSLYHYDKGEFKLVETLKTGDDGRIYFPELGIGTLYKLVEEKAPAGYAMVTKEVFFKVIAEGETTSFNFYDSVGNIVSAPLGVSGEYVTGNRNLILTVENVKGQMLPATGGTGTLIYIIFGLMLIIGPFIYGFRLRRRYERRSRN